VPANLRAARLFTRAIVAKPTFAFTLIGEFVCHSPDRS
jgi:hypothetical protein